MSSSQTLQLKATYENNIKHPPQIRKTKTTLKSSKILGSPTMTPPLSTDRRILSVFPFILCSLLFVGTTRVLIENARVIVRYRRYSHPANVPIAKIANASSSFNFSRVGSSLKGCNVFQGRWTRDNKTRPLYEEQSCPYLTKQMTCQRNGRPDSLYQNWRWEPHACKLPRFDALKMLEMIRGRRIMFVGDSIQRTQWESMVCLIQSAIPEGKKYLQRDPPKKIFRIQSLDPIGNQRHLKNVSFTFYFQAYGFPFQFGASVKMIRKNSWLLGVDTSPTAIEYDAAIEYYWAPFIVESNSDHATNHTVLKRFVKLDSISKHSEHWKGVDLFIFESYVWWMYKPIINATIGPLYKVQEYNVTDAYRLALRTWSEWLDSNINPANQGVFFMSMSPTHLWRWEWNAGSKGNCFNESLPIQEPSYWGTGSNLEIMGIMADALKKLKTKVTLLNITQLSEFRKDAHTSVYTERKGKLLTKEQRADPDTYADCIHWCLPGVPDTWNEILSHTFIVVGKLKGSFGSALWLYLAYNHGERRELSFSDCPSFGQKLVVSFSHSPIHGCNCHLLLAVCRRARYGNNERISGAQK
ncbi:hypothetical protein ACLOJK_009372 [Asimina triloba]